MTAAAPVSIRLAQAGDVAAISDLVTVLIRCYVLPDQPSAAASPLLEWAGAAAIGQRIAAGQRHHVAEIGTRLVGIVGTCEDSYLNLLFVDRRFHGRGIARSLWNAALAACVEATRPARITVNSSAFAVSAYRRLGFIELGPQTLDRGLLVTPMELRLRSGDA